MYNLSKILKLDAEIQKELEQLAAKYEPLINKAVKAQLKTGDVLITGMGSGVLKTSKGEPIETKDFLNHIINYQYGGSFRLNIDINDIDK